MYCGHVGVEDEPDAEGVREESCDLHGKTRDHAPILCHVGLCVFV